MTPDRDALRAAVVASPDDDTPRLIYADWLDEHGDDADRAHAEFIRLAVRLAGIDPADWRYDAPDARCWELWREYRGRWGADEPDAWPYYPPLKAYPRGFAERRHISEDKLGTADLESTLARFPITDVTIGMMGPLTPGGVRTDAPPSRFPRWEYLPTVRNLSFCDDCFQDAEDARRLLASPLLTGLRELTVPRSFTDADVGLIADDPRYRSLRRLTLDAEGVGDAGLGRIAASPHLLGLTGLTLWHSGATDAGLDRLAGATFFPRLEHLEVAAWDRQSGQTTAGIDRLLHDARLGRLTSLGLPRCEFGDRIIASLAANPAGFRLRTLDLSGNALTAAGVSRLVRLPELSGVAELSLWGNPVTGVWLTDFARTSIRRLRSLDLSDCDLHDWDVELLCRTRSLAGLRCLELGENPIGDAGAVALATSAVVPGLRRLNMMRCRVGPDGARALAGSPLGRWMCWGDLYLNPVTDAWPGGLRHEYFRRPITDRPA